MWWSADGDLPGICACLAVLVAALATAACGFKPLYGTSPVGEGVAVHLASIDIVEQKTRLGQLIRNDLLSSMSEPGASGGHYRLAFESTSPDPQHDRSRA